MRFNNVNDFKTAQKQFSAILGAEKNKVLVCSGTGCMACPDGCIGGGGQPPACNARKEERYQGIFEADKECALRSSEQNPALDGIYKLLNGRAHELLHIHYPDHNR